MKKKLKDTLLVLTYLGAMGWSFGISIYRAIPANGWSEYDRGAYATMAPLFGLFFLLGIGAAIGMVVEWREGSNK